MIKITHLTSVHLRYDIRIFHKECTSLEKNKQYTINLIVADNKKNEFKNNINIYSVGKPKDKFNRIFQIAKKIFAKAIELDSDIYHFHDPELILVGLKLKKLGKKVIFDIHENTDLQILEKKWIPFYLRRLISFVYSKYEAKSCMKFDYLIVPQNAMYNKFRKFNKTIVIGNFPNKTDILKNTNVEYSKYNLMYSGSINEARGLWNMLELIVELRRLNENYNLTIAGNIGNLDLIKAKKHKGWKFITYLGYLDQKELQKVYIKNSIGLILFNNVGQYHMAYSLKLFEYMKNNMMIIMPNFGDWLEFNAKNKVGINVDTNNSMQIAKKIDALLFHDLELYGNSNKKLVNEEFSWESQEKKLIRIYKEIVNDKKI